jgi:glycosyltransferase involved in cell wall biosynthesis
VARRILLVTNRIPFPLADGGALAMDAMIRGYHEAGWDVFLLAMNTSRHYLDERSRGGLYRHLYAFETVEVDNRIRFWPVIRNFIFRRTPEHADRYNKPEFGKKLQQILSTFQPHVVQLESVYLNVYLDVIRKNSAAKLVQRLHNVEWQIWHRLALETRDPLRRWYLLNLARRVQRFEIEAWNEADLLLPITAVDEHIITETGCKTSRHVTPFGIIPTDDDHDALKESPAQWKGYHLAAMDWLPNQDAMDWFVREIWPLIHGALPNFHFWFAGRNMPHRFLHGLPSGIICEGTVADASAFVQDKQILLVPLRSGGGIRVKILEAMSAGKLVVSTATGMQGIIAVAGVHYLEANTPEQFRDVLLKVLNEPEAARQIAARGRLLVRQQYDRRIIMDGLIQQLESIN